MKSNNPALLKNQWQAGQPARDEEAKVSAVYGGPEKPLANDLMREAENYKHLLQQNINEVVAKNVHGFVPESGDILFGRVFDVPKVKETKDKYPDLWTEFMSMNKRLSEYAPQNRHYGNMIYKSKTIQEADGYANTLKEIHARLYGKFQDEVYHMSNQFNAKLKSVCNPPIMIPDNPEPIQPFGDPYENAQQADQPNQANNDEVARLMQMVEDMRGQLQDMRGANTDLRADKIEMRERLAQKDIVIAEQNTTITDFRTEVGDLQARLVEKDVAITELRTDKENLTQEVTNKDVTINGLNLALEQEHTRYEDLNERYTELLGQMPVPE